VFYFTGGNSSRLEGLWFDAAARAARVRLVVPDRPGFGLSDPHPGRTLRDWPADVEALADALDLPRYAAFGLSGGGPHAAALAHAAPERLTRVAIVSGLAPPEMPHRYRSMWPPVRLLFMLRRFLPPLARLALTSMGSFYADADQLRARMLQSLPEPDRELIEQRPEIIDVFSRAAQEAHRNGVAGDFEEWGLYLRPWGFALAEIEGEVGLWYGAEDRNAPLAMGRWLAAELPHSSLEVVRGGHFSTVNTCIDDILAWLTREPVN
jgi:pimeloyl-ACP methyl ester carboxylesterase